MGNGYYDDPEVLGAIVKPRAKPKVRTTMVKPRAKPMQTSQTGKGDSLLKTAVKSNLLPGTKKYVLRPPGSASGK